MVKSIGNLKMDKYDFLIISPYQSTAIISVYNAGAKINTKLAVKSSSLFLFVDT